MTPRTTSVAAPNSTHHVKHASIDNRIVFLGKQGGDKQGLQSDHAPKLSAKSAMFASNRERETGNCGGPQTASEDRRLADHTSMSIMVHAIATVSGSHSLCCAVGSLRWARVTRRQAFQAMAHGPRYLLSKQPQRSFPLLPAR